MPDFDIRDHGYDKLSDLAGDCIFLEVERVCELIQVITVTLVPVTMDVPRPRIDLGPADEPRRANQQ
jgi:hypothetical protein